MGCCLFRNKNSWSHQSGGNGDFSNIDYYQITRGKETRSIRKEPCDRRPLQEIIETVTRSSDSENLENSTFSGDVIKDLDIGNISNDRTVTRLCSQSKYTIYNMLSTFRV